MGFFHLFLIILWLGYAVHVSVLLLFISTINAESLRLLNKLVQYFRYGIEPIGLLAALVGALMLRYHLQNQNPVYSPLPIWFFVKITCVLCYLGLMWLQYFSIKKMIRTGQVISSIKRLSYLVLFVLLMGNILFFIKFKPFVA